MLSLVNLVQTEIHRVLDRSVSGGSVLCEIGRLSPFPQAEDHECLDHVQLELCSCRFIVLVSLLDSCAEGVDEVVRLFGGRKRSLSSDLF